MTSATEVLRRMLDERGVEHSYEDVTEGTLFVVTRDVRIYYILAREKGFKVWSNWLTPEQAITATLGAGTCHDLGGTGANGEQVFNCSECGCVLSLYDSDGTNTLCTSFIHDYPRYCPECGRKVVDE